MCSHVPVPRNDSKSIILEKDYINSKPRWVEVLELGERVQKLLLLFYAFNNCLRSHMSHISCLGMIIP